MKISDYILKFICISLVIIFTCQPFVLHSHHLNTNNKNLYYFYSDNKYTQQTDETENIDKEEIGGYILLVLGLSVFVIPGVLLKDANSEILLYQNYPFHQEDSFYYFNGRNYIQNFKLLSSINENNKINNDFSLSYRYKRHNLELGYSNLRKYDNDLNSLNLGYLYTFARSEYLIFRSGLSYHYQDHDTDFHGASFNYKIDLFKKPIHTNISYDLHYSKKDYQNKAFYNNNLQLSLGILYNRYELELGYSFKKINNYRFNGPLMTVGVWY